MSMTGCFRHLPPERLVDVEGDAHAIIDLLLATDEGGSAFDIEKAWHVVHYLITGTAWQGEGPASRALLGGRVISEDLGYGPARWLDAEEVNDIAEALEELDPALLASRFDARELLAQEIYPFAAATAEDVDEEARQWAVESFQSLRRYYREAASAGHGMLLALL